MRRVYLDTSAYLCIILGEANHQNILKLIQKKELCSSVFLFLEAERNLVRLSREGILSADECTQSMKQLQKDQDFFLTRDLTLDLCLKSEYPPVRTPRSADLLHLRTAKWFQQNSGLEYFVTLDQAQRGSALDLGLPVSSF